MPVMAWHLLISPSVEVPFICSSRRSHKSLFSSCQIDLMRVENLERVEASLPKLARNYNSNTKQQFDWQQFVSLQKGTDQKSSQSCASCCIKASAVSQPKDFINSRHETGTCTRATNSNQLSFLAAFVLLASICFKNPHWVKRLERTKRHPKMSKLSWRPDASMCVLGTSSSNILIPSTSLYPSLPASLVCSL